MARPRKPPPERLTESVHFRVLPSDFLRVTKAAENAGMGLTDYARRQLLAGRVIVHQTRKLDHAAYDQSRRIGVNLNQLTRLAHTKDIMPPPGLSEVCTLIEQFLREHIAYGSESHQEGPKL